ncbi:hypothetical protein SAMN05421684_7378 [Asanoa ishikariensis]|uniref:Uncharacterized protein n=1 Tax=Asanoa ishikariensis TaxID=137265 RepID=A0A1H3UI43_9ACTN|nr:hypothetical protein [Asanoa ishikariensis]SDZ62098.1 hypothetical protein SAMN05421684_7378 [Asanoa ishikariensis]
MTDERSRKRPRSGRARKRLVRAHAAHAGVAYSVAARQVAAAGLAAGETLGDFGRTVYPLAVRGDGRWSLGSRAARPADVRLADARRGAGLPGGRAGHLVDRFPPTRAAHGPLYAGDGRAALLAMLYLVSGAPSCGERDRAAATGEETAVDLVCADVDRAARRLLDGDWTILWDRIDGALTAGAYPRLRSVFRAFRDEAGAPWTGARQVLDALLVVADDGHAPGTRVRAGLAAGSVTGLWWAATGPPVGYDVWFDGAAGPRRVRPGDIVVLPRQETP